MELYNLILLVIRIIVVGMALLVVLVFVVRPMIKAFSQKPDDIALHRYRTERSIASAPFEEEHTEAKLSNLAPERKNKIIVDKALEDQEKTTLLIRNWLHEKK